MGKDAYFCRARSFKSVDGGALASHVRRGSGFCSKPCRIRKRLPSERIYPPYKTYSIGNASQVIFRMFQSSADYFTSPVALMFPPKLYRITRSST